MGVLWLEVYMGVSLRVLTEVYAMCMQDEMLQHKPVGEWLLKG